MHVPFALSFSHLFTTKECSFIWFISFHFIYLILGRHLFFSFAVAFGWSVSILATLCCSFSMLLGFLLIMRLFELSPSLSYFFLSFCEYYVCLCFTFFLASVCVSYFIITGSLSLASRKTEIKNSHFEILCERCVKYIYNVN